MSYNNLAILGLGLIGGSLAKSIKHVSPDIIVAAYDFSDVVDQAFEQKVIDVKLNSIQDSLNYEIIFLALPINTSLDIFKDLSPQLNHDQIISDLCSVKGIFANEWSKFNSKGLYVGAHPMTGKEKSGFSNSDSLLFENSIFIISEHASNSEGISKYISLVKSIGARISFLDPYLHDKIVAKVSHLPQLLSVLLVNQTHPSSDGIQYIDYAAGGFRDMTRIASSDFRIWDSILKHNKQEILAAIDSFEKDLSALKKLLADENSIAISEMFDKARTLRMETPISSKGFLDPLFDISVFLKDEPGMISKLSTILFKNNINIKDIELLKIREGSGGNFKLYFESKQEANRAKEVLESAGFKSN